LLIFGVSGEMLVGVEAAGAARTAHGGGGADRAGSRYQDLRLIGARGGYRIHGGSAETGYCEGDDEGADGEIFHVRVSPWAGLKISKDFSGQTR
jgi:hypothetical protein